MFEETVTKMFRDEPGALAIAIGETRFKRDYVTPAIPESVLKLVRPKAPAETLSPRLPVGAGFIERV